MNNWGQQPNGQPYNGHNYQQIPQQHGYHPQQQQLAQQHPQQQQQQQQQQHQQQQQQQQQQYGTGIGNGNAMAYMGNHQYQATGHFMPLPNPQMQPMPQYSHGQPSNNFQAPHHQQYNNGAYAHHAPAPQHHQYIPHPSYPPQQVATPPQRPMQQPLAPQQPMSHVQHIPQKSRPPAQLQPARVNSPHMANQHQPMPQPQPAQTNSPHMTNQHQPMPQPQPVQMASPYMESHQQQAMPQPQPAQINSPHMASTQQQAMPLPLPLPQLTRMNSPQVPTTQLQSAIQSPRLQVEEVRHQAPSTQTQRHISDSIDPTKLMMKTHAPARKSMPASGITKSPSLSTRSPSISHAQTPSSHFDTPAVLICVADDCFQVAHSAVQNISTSLDQTNMDEYYKLIATGLGCLDAALSLNKLPPRTEANIRLRYATILSEETDNLMEAETALTKGITVCEKNRFMDLKYCMQFQLLKVLFRRNRKAAFIAVDKNIQDAMTYKAVDWVYAFRFLRASFHLQTGNPADAQALENLRSITSIANPRGDLVIAVLTSLLEGIMHLKSRKDDSIIRVQTCIAQASRYQLDPSVHIPQIDVLTLLLDLACSLQQKAPTVAMQKLKALQVRMDELVQAHDWDKCLDQLLVPLKKQPNSSALVTADTKTIIQSGPGEYNFIVLSFVTKVHAFVLAYVLSGLALLYQGSKSEKVMEYWTEALNMLAKSPQQVRPPAYSLPMAIEQAKWRAEVACYIYTLIALISATRTQWVRVHDCLQKIEALNPKPEDGRLGLLVLYVNGIYHQGTGDLYTAFQIFNDPRFAIPDADRTSNNAAAIPPSEVALLAALNRIWIMQEPSYRDDYQVAELIEKITPYCSDHTDIDIRTAFNLALAAIQTEPRQSIQTIKRHIQAGLKWAQNANNTHLLSISLNLMRAMLFENVVGDQAVKSAKAGRAQANKAGNMLWMSVGDGMLAQTEEMQGQAEQAEMLRQSGTQLAIQAFTKP